MEFAKLYEIEGIGQVLVTKDQTDEGDPCVTVRVPDYRDCVIQTHFSFQDMDAVSEAAAVENLFEATDLLSAQNVARGIMAQIEKMGGA